MEKLHKYCLSVLLVIICSNISAQNTTCSAENTTIHRLYDVYHQFLNSQDCEGSHLSERKHKIHYTAISQKQNAGDLSSNRDHNPGFNEHGGRGEAGKYDEILRNFEKKAAGYASAKAFNFKSKVSKIRNKDYLDIIS
ncbi:hypothetical protein PFY10_12510 [Chryseobacterium daecheongense]|nr:hypothetical protein PFY10_12510 [Chryseobacterium daecheongense]